MAPFTELLNFSVKADSKLSSVLRFFLKPRLGFKKATGTAAAKVPTKHIGSHLQITLQNWGMLKK